MSILGHCSLRARIDRIAVIRVRPQHQDSFETANHSIVIFHDTVSPRAYSYAHIRGSSIGFGQVLRKTWNWQKGDVLSIYSPNDVDYATVVFGCLWAGGIVTTTNPAYTIDEFAHQLRDSRAKAIVTQAPLLRNALAAAKKAGIEEDKIILMGPNAVDTPVSYFTSLPGFTMYGLNEHVKRPFWIDPDEDLCFLVYSSGTTGKPKGVMLSHRNIVANTIMISRANKGHVTCGDGSTGSGDRTIGFLPFFHIYGWQSLEPERNFVSVSVTNTRQVSPASFTTLFTPESKSSSSPTSHSPSSSLSSTPTA